MDEERTAIRTANTSLPAELTLRRMIHGYRMSACIRTMALLGIADQLAGGPQHLDALAGATGIKAPHLFRLMRVLVELDLCAWVENDRIELTTMGRLMRTDRPDSFHASAMTMASDWMQRAWTGLPDALRTGESAFIRIHGMDYWEYLSAHPEEEAYFDAAMTRGSTVCGEALFAARDLASIGTLVDVGGGQGRLLATVLTAVPGLRGVLADRPGVLARAATLLDAAGVADRCDLVPTDFFSAVPSGGDAYVLARIVHDWPDAEALTILQACRAAMSSGSRLWLIEEVMPPHDATLDLAYIDLNMLVLFGAGQRTEQEYRDLLQRAGFNHIVATPSKGGWSIIEAIPGSS